MRRIEQASGLDPASDGLRRIAHGALRPQWLRDVLHGRWLGHPLHPALVQVPAGAWLGAAILDLVPGQRRASTTLVAVGVTAAVPTAVAGLNDWATLSTEQRRTGLVHAAANSGALVLYGGSLLARLAGRHRLGRWLGYTAFGLVSVGGYLGGHLSYRQAAGVDPGALDPQAADGRLRAGATTELSR